MNQMPDMCPGTHMEPKEDSTCPVCDFVWVNVKFSKIVPTHGLASEQQKKKALEWAAETLRYAV